MRLNEYHTLRSFSEFGIPIIMGEIANTADEVYKIVTDFDTNVFMKAQNQQNKEIRYASTPDEAYDHAENLLSVKLDNLLVRPSVEIKYAIYVGITYDRSTGQTVFVTSLDHVTFRQYIDPLIGLRSYQIIAAATDIDLPREYWSEFNHIVRSLHTCFVTCDALLAEITPLAITMRNQMLAIDGKMTIDDNALYRQPRFEALQEDQTQIQARQAGFTYIELDGQIGCIVNGAGLAMATMDILHDIGGNNFGPANFLDIGGAATIEKARIALKIILMNQNIKSIFINIFGGMTKCDDLILGVIEEYQTSHTSIPVVVRLQGTKSIEGRKIVNDAKIPSFTMVENLTEGAQKAVEAAQQGE